MRAIKCELVRIKTRDGLELHGALFEPERRSRGAIIHVHGWVGNFYENSFIDHIPRAILSEGFAFLTFNNRATGFITDFIKRKGNKVEYVKIGGSLEKFEDCIIDIEAARQFLNRRGYGTIILEGHSSGCQKIIYYNDKSPGKLAGLILLAPVDNAACSKMLLGKKYSKALKTAKSMVKGGAKHEGVPQWMSFYPALSAGTFLNVADPKSISGALLNYSGKLQKVNNIRCPVLAISGSKDHYQDAPMEKLRLLKMHIKDCRIYLIRGADHNFVGSEPRLTSLIGNWVRKLQL